MDTVCGSGRATNDDTTRAVTEAVEMAKAQASDRVPSLALLFVSANRDLEAALAAASAFLPDTDVVGCTSFGEVSDRGATTGGVSCLLISWGEASHRSVFVPEQQPTAALLCEALCTGLEDDVHHNAARGQVCSTSVLFGDGLSPQLEQFVAHARKVAPPGHTLVGAGAAADGFGSVTRVGAGRQAAAGASAVVHVFSKHNWGIGVGHGVHAASPRMTVTRARGNVVYEINGRPAFGAYREHVVAAEGTDLTQLTALVQNELGVYLFEELVRVRAPLAITPDGAMICAGEVPEGSTVCVVRGEPAEVIAAAGEAAREALQHLGDKPAAGVLVFSCMCRGLSLGERYPEEVAAIRQVFPDAPIAGFLSYGEIAQTGSRLGGYHNDTVVVVAIPA